MGDKVRRMEKGLGNRGNESGRPSPFSLPLPLLLPHSLSLCAGDKFVSQGDGCGDKGEGVIKGDSGGAERQRLTG